MPEYITPLPALLAHALETAINRVLQLDMESPTRVNKLQGRLLQVDLKGLAITLFFTFKHGVVRVRLKQMAHPIPLSAVHPWHCFPWPSPMTPSGVCRIQKCKSTAMPAWPVTLNGFSANWNPTGKARWPACLAMSPDTRSPRVAPGRRDRPGNRPNRQKGSVRHDQRPPFVRHSMRQFLRIWHIGVILKRYRLDQLFNTDRLPGPVRWMRVFIPAGKDISGLPRGERCAWHCRNWGRSM